jgi:hypothetical protein
MDILPTSCEELGRMDEGGVILHWVQTASHADELRSQWNTPLGSQRPALLGECTESIDVDAVSDDAHPPTWVAEANHLRSGRMGIRDDQMNRMRQDPIQVE